MAAPNMFNAIVITGNTDVLNVTTSATAITSNPSSSGKVYKINTLIVSNISGANTADITVDLFRSSVSYKIASTVTIPADATLVVITKDSGIYLQENDSLRCLSSADGSLQAICSYEVIDD
jgi:hypothetical protein